MTNIIVPEVDVLSSTITYLATRDAIPIQISPPAGQGIDTSKFKSEMNDLFASVGHSPNFQSSGPDIIGYSSSEIWFIECKGSGTGKPSTQRNNFDRALSSVVSYYVDEPPDFASDANVFLGLALPKTIYYTRELHRRVGIPLRKRLNLWVLLYNNETDAIEPILPESEYGFSF